MNKRLTRQCWGCKAEFPINEKHPHYQSAGIGRYGVASPECLAAFFEILAKESELYGYPATHRLMVDAYAVQHPRRPEWQETLHIEPRLIRASIQSVTVHLVALYCAFELHIDLYDIANVMDTLLSNVRASGAQFEELTPPDDLGEIKAIDVKKELFSKPHSLEEYTQLGWKWAQSAWDAWKEHHDAIRHWYETYS